MVLTVTASVADQVDAFAAAIVDAAQAARAHGPVEVPADLAGAIGALPVEQITPELVATLAANLGLGESEASPLPERQALINAVLDAAPVPIREALLAAFLSLLQQPTY